MSESYKLPSRKKRSQPEDPQHRQDMLSHDKPGRWAHDKHGQDDPADDPMGSTAHPDLRGRSGHVQKALEDTGLESSASDEQEEEQEAQQPRKKRRSGCGMMTLQGQDHSGSNPFGALVRQNDLKQGPGKHVRSDVDNAAAC